MPVGWFELRKTTNCTNEERIHTKTQRRIATEATENSEVTEKRREENHEGAKDTKKTRRESFFVKEFCHRFH